MLGCLPWCVALTWLGAVLGARWETVEGVIQPVAWAIAVAIVIAVVVLVRRRWHTVQAEYAALDAARAGETDPS